MKMNPTDCYYVISFDTMTIEGRPKMMVKNFSMCGNEAEAQEVQKALGGIILKGVYFK